MSRSSPKKSRRRKDRQPLLDMGLNALLLGLGLWLLPAFLSGKSLSGNVPPSLLKFAWPLIGIGALLICIHYMLKGIRVIDEARSIPKIDPILRGDSFANPIAQHEPSDIWRSGSSEVAGAPKTSNTLTEWSPAVFNAIEWRRFEAVCEALFAQAGFEARSQSHGPDGGVDVWLYSKHTQGPALVVQCKHWSSKPVGVKEVREFFGVMASHQLKRGTYATTSTFTTDATAFAKQNGIHLLDGKGLLALIAQRTPEQQQALLAVAFEGDYARPTCASCGVKMVERANRQTGSPFWGCTNYPRCKSKIAMAKHRV